MKLEKVNDKTGRLIFIPLIGITLPLLLETYKGAIGSTSFYGHLLISILFTLVIWQGNRYIVMFMRGHFPGYANTVRRVAYQVLFSSFFTVVTIVLLWEFFREISSNLLGDDDLILNIEIGLACTFFISSIYESIYFFGKWKQSIVEAEALKRSNIHSQFETLKNQVNPHFLFNSLNTLSSIIEEDPHTAVRFVQQLSNVYRYVLQSREKELVDLKTEIEFIRSYLFLHEIRFGENLKVDIQIPESDYNKKVPPLVLQLLIENAIKHNIISREKPLYIDIFMDNDRIAVRNNLQKKSSVEYSSGVGLDNIINRYKILTSEPVEIKDNPSDFTVYSPVLNPAL